MSYVYSVNNCLPKASNSLFDMLSDVLITFKILLYLQKSTPDFMRWLHHRCYISLSRLNGQSWQDCWKILSSTYFCLLEIVANCDRLNEMITSSPKLLSFYWSPCFVVWKAESLRHGYMNKNAFHWNMYQLGQHKIFILLKVTSFWGKWT